MDFADKVNFPRSSHLYNKHHMPNIKIHTLLYICALKLHDFSFGVCLGSLNGFVVLITPYQQICSISILYGDLFRQNFWRSHSSPYQSLLLTTSVLNNGFNLTNTVLGEMLVG